MRFADRICGLMDGMMGSEVKERMREQICWGGVWGCGGRGSSPFPDKLNLRLGCSTLLCLSSRRALCSGSQPASGMVSGPARPPPLPPPTDVLAQPFPLPPSSSAASFHLRRSFFWLLLTSSFSYLHSFFRPFFSSSSFNLPVARQGPDQSLRVSIAILCVLMSLVLTMCS